MDDRTLMSRQEAARALDMSLSHFQRHAQLFTRSAGR